MRNFYLTTIQKILIGILIVGGLVGVSIYFIFIRREVVFVPPSQAMRDPLVVEDPDEISFGIPYKLGQNEASTILAKVKKVGPHPERDGEHLLYLDLKGSDPGIEKVPFVIAPLLEEEEPPDIASQAEAFPFSIPRETFIYYASLSSGGEHEQTKASAFDLEEGITVFVTYRINPFEFIQNEEAFAVTISIQGFIY